MSAQQKMNDGTLAIPQPNIDKRRGLAIAKPNESSNIDGIEKPDEELSWLGRRFAELGVIVMASAKPSNWNFNPSTITAYIVIIGAFLTAVGVIASGAYYLGYKDREMMELREQLKETKEKAEQAKSLSLAKTSEVGHTDPDKTPEKKKK